MGATQSEPSPFTVCFPNETPSSRPNWKKQHAPPAGGVASITNRTGAPAAGSDVSIRTVMTIPFDVADHTV